MRTALAAAAAAAATLALLDAAASTALAQPPSQDDEDDRDDHDEDPTTRTTEPAQPAQPRAPTVIPPPPTLVPPLTHYTEPKKPRTPLLTIAGGAGFSGFTGNTLRDTTDVGGSWTIRAAARIIDALALEISYIGSIQTIDALGIDENALLVGNGAQVALRLNAPATSAPFSPFIYGGAAWRHYSLNNTDTNTSDVLDSDDVFELPAGVGITASTGGLIIDLRGEVAYVMDADMVPDLTADGTIDRNDDAPMHRWGINLSVGVPL